MKRKEKLATLKKDVHEILIDIIFTLLTWAKMPHYFTSFKQINSNPKIPFHPLLGFLNNLWP